MKQYIVILGFLCTSAITIAQRTIDVLHYSYSIEVSDSSDRIYGFAKISFAALQTISSIELDLVSVNSASKGMKVTEVTFEPFSTTHLSFKQEKDKLIITLQNTLQKGDTSSVSVYYKGIPPDGLIISKNKYGHRTFFSDNWPNRAHNWIPCVDDIADKATVEFIVKAPSHYQVISNGVQIEESTFPDNKKITHWKEEVPLPTKVMVIGVADFAVNTVGDINCVPVSSWVFPENRTEGFYDYAQAKDVLSWYMDYIGPYAYKKLANVQSKTTFGGMENASAIFYYENSVSGKRQEEALLAHEIVHQWFGNHATEKSFAHLWLSEGFATYLTHVYLETRYGTDSLNNRMQHDREEVIDFVKTSRRPVVDSNKNYMQLLNANSYQKGGWILHMLRRQLGDSVFRKSVRQYYAQYAGKNAETKDLQKVFETVSGKNLEPFFLQWLHTPANPDLKITWEYLVKEKKLTVAVQQLQTERVFTMPLELEINFPGQKKRNVTLDINSASQAFTFPFAEKPSSLKADPKTSLLFEGKVTEIN